MLCDNCKEPIWSSKERNGKHLCLACERELRKEEIRESASQAESCEYFKDWSSKDRTTAFFETFGKYVKSPNKHDFYTIYHIWNWAVHDDKALAETIRYTLKWANMSIAGEYKRWKNAEKQED